MAIRNDRELRISRRIASAWALASMCVAVLIGVVGYSVSVTGRIPLLGSSAESETIIVHLANVMSDHGALLAIVAGIILAGILAATMSTADSQLLAAASSVSQDAAEFLGVRLTGRKSLLVARLTVIGVALIGLMLAWNPNSSVFRMVSFAWAGFGAGFGPVMLLSLFWKRSNRAGALTGMITGGAMVFVWKYCLAPLGGAFAIYELLPAFLLALAADGIVSLLTSAPEVEICRMYDKVAGLCKR